MRRPSWLLSALAVAVVASLAPSGLTPDAQATPDTHKAAGQPALRGGTAASPVPMPKVEGPISGGSPTGGPWWETPYDLESRGYLEQEYFLSGVASDRGLRCAVPPLPGTVGLLSLLFAQGCEPGGEVHTAPYKVRVLVRRPLHREQFKGSAVLEWANVSLQMEIEHDWAIDAPTIMREGMVSAMVSAQPVGVQGPGPFTLKTWAPERYGSLSHPGDQYSYDIYAQAAKALRSGRLTGAARPEILIGSGTSQSCSYLTNYIPYLAARDRLFDAFMPTLCPATANIPDDVVPVLFGTSEGESQLASRDDGRLLRVWEIPGSHINYYEGSQAQSQIEAASGIGPGVWDEDEAGQYGERGHPIVSGRTPASALLNNTIPARYAFRAALHWLNQWARQYKSYRQGRISADRVQPPPIAPRFARSGPLVRHDANGNPVGGVPQPAIDVPVATYATPAVVGQTIPFDPARLLALYPDHATYVKKMQAATDKAVAGGFMLPTDAREWMERVRVAPIGGVLGALPIGK